MPRQPRNLSHKVIDCHSSPRTAVSPWKPCPASGHRSRSARADTLSLQHVRHSGRRAQRVLHRTVSSTGRPH
eukprot:ctg_653.g275